MTEETTATENQTSFDVIAELKLAVQIFDHAAEQGAFKGWGVVNEVLGCRGRLVAIIELMSQALAPPATDETSADTAVVTPEPAVAETEPTVQATVVPDAEKLAAIQKQKDEYMQKIKDLDAQANNAYVQDCIDRMQKIEDLDAQANNPGA